MSVLKENVKGTIWVNLVPVLLVFVIACCGFIAGALQNGFATDADRFNTLQAKHERTADLMNNLIRNVVERDQSRILEAYRILGEDIQGLISEWVQLITESILPPEFLGAENITHRTQIRVKLDAVDRNMRETLTHALYDHFYLQNQDNNFLLAEKIVHGFDYNITRGHWDGTWNAIRQEMGYEISDTMGEKPTGDYINNSLFGETGLPLDILNQIIAGAPPTLFIIERPEALDWVLVGLMIEERFKAEQYEVNATLASDIAEGLAIAVSVTTVAVVLSTAMSARIERRRTARQVSLIRADLQEDAELAIPTADVFALPILVIAAIVSLGALILVL
ncbi:MAG: hypothetical protein ACFFDI_02325, partial [Promethearchaeota archaeon]